MATAASLSVAGAAAAADLVDVRTRLAEPRLAELSGKLGVARTVLIDFDTPAWNVAIAMPHCTWPAPTPAEDRAILNRCDGSTGAEGNAWGVAAQQLRAIWKVPEWRRGWPLLDLSLRTWRATGADTMDRRTGTAAAAEVEATHEVGPHDAVAGYSFPVSIGRAGDMWQTGWLGLMWRPASGTSLHLMVERAHETQSGSHETLLSAQLARSYGPAGRVVASVTRTRDDSDAAWRAEIRFHRTF